MSAREPPGDSIRVAFDRRIGAAANENRASNISLLYVTVTSIVDTHIPNSETMSAQPNSTFAAAAAASGSSSRLVDAVTRAAYTADSHSFTIHTR